MSKYHVRDARGPEVFRLADSAALVLEESPTYRGLHIDSNKIANYLLDGVNKRPGVFLRVIARSDDDVVVGGLMCVCETTLFGSDKVAYDITIMVNQMHRGPCFVQLLQVIKEYKTWATAEGAKVIKFGVSSGLNMDAASKFFERLGFKRIGSMHAVVVGE